MKATYLTILLVTCVWARAVEEMDVGDSENVKEITVLEVPEPAENNYSDAEARSGIGRWYGAIKIAFSAYLSACRHYGTRQHIKFDKVLLNDGDAYEAAKGVFRPKVSGVYMFTYVIAQRNQREIRANLVYDGTVINGAVAEGRHRYHDVQGTNTAIIHVTQNKPVWVEVSSAGYLEGNAGKYRFTTFSGYLLYAKS